MMATLVRALDRALERLYLAAGAAAAVFLVVLALGVLTSIVSRLLGIYIAGITEYSRYAMAAASFLALAHTFREGGHIRVALLRSRLAGRARLAVEIWCLALASFFSGFLAFYLARMAWVSHRFEERSEGGDAMLLWMPQSIAALGAVIMATACTHALVKTCLTRDADAFVKPASRLARGDG